MSTLLLNATWEPLRVITWRRAVVLVLQDMAEIVERGNGEVRSPSVSVPMPDVIRLNRFVKVPYRSRIPLNTRNVLGRDSHKCGYCGGRAHTVDHIVPRSRGGLHRWENVVAACRRCNTDKDDMTLSELQTRFGAERWTLRVKPFVPKGDLMVVFGFSPKESWAPYLQYQVT